MTPDDAVRRDRSVMLALYRQLFDALERDGVKYCVWKNLNELPDALHGHGDIDLHVRPGSRAAFLEALRTHRFVRVETHKAYPWVAHFYGFDAPSGTLCHLHCYFRLVTGESHIKQYVVPIERHLDALPAVKNAFGVREMHPWLQDRLYLFRRRIKLSCLPGALLFHRERAGYRAERMLLERHRDVPVGRVPGDGWPATIAASDSLRHDVAAGLAYRGRFRHWSRLAPFTTAIVRYGVMFPRALGKLLGWRKTLPSGLLVMVTEEGARRGRVPKELSEWLDPALRLRSFHLPDADGATTPNRLLRRCRGRRSTLRAAVRSATNGSIAVCYGWHPSRLCEILLATADAPETSISARRTLKDSIAQLDNAAEPDVILHVGEVAASDADCRGAALVEVGAAASGGWRQALWTALVERQL